MKEAYIFELCGLEASVEEQEILVRLEFGRHGWSELLEW